MELAVGVNWDSEVLWKGWTLVLILDTCTLYLLCETMPQFPHGRERRVIAFSSSVRGGSCDFDAGKKLEAGSDTGCAGADMSLVWCLQNT